MGGPDSSLDCRGLACPEPVLRVKQALEGIDRDALTVLVDSSASRDNVRRFAESQGASVTVQEEPGGGWRLLLSKGCSRGVPAVPAGPPPPEAPTAFLIVSDRLGPEPELGELLIRALLATLAQARAAPAKLLFLNRGVHLTTEGSPVVAILEELAAAGTEILSCGTCLDFFGKRDLLRVGRVSNLYETVETLTGTHRVVTLG